MVTADVDDGSLQAD